MFIPALNRRRSGHASGASTPNVVQAGADNFWSNSGHVSVPLSFNVSAGNTVLLVVEVNSNSDNVSSIANSGSASWTATLLGKKAGASWAYDMEIWKLPITASGSLSVSCTQVSGNSYGTYAIETSNVSTFAFSSANTTSSTPSLGQSASTGAIVLSSAVAENWQSGSSPLRHQLPG